RARAARGGRHGAPAAAGLRRSRPRARDCSAAPAAARPGARRLSAPAPSRPRPGARQQRGVVPGDARAPAGAAGGPRGRDRGLGVIDVEALFGTLATLDERQIDLVVELVEWPGGADRLGLVAGSYALLEVELPLVRVPVRPGRSMAMLIETAARNHLLRARG